ncbi:MAG: hypothetical protein HY867_19710 [Chloroflexi bacterium]|nr:hypothetical protein [Chloroflexota bacterium]
MANRTIETSPQFLARSTGLLYLIVIAAGIIAQMVIIGSVSQILWFLTKGVNAQQWNRRAVAPA